MIKDTLFLVRHGRTDWNEEGRFQGLSDIPLSERGRADAQANAERLVRHLAETGTAAGHVRVFSSPLRRCVDTAAIISDRLGIGRTPPAVDPLLSEAGFGTWEGLTTHEVKARFPEQRRSRKADRWNFAPPGGGSYAELAAKMKLFIDCLPKDIIPLVVTHSGNLRVTIGMLEGLDRDETLRQAVPHDRVFRWSQGKLSRI